MFRSGCQTSPSDEQRQILHNFSKSHIKTLAKSETELQGFWLHRAIPSFPICQLFCTLDIFFLNHFGIVSCICHGGHLLNEALHNALKDNSYTKHMQHLGKELISLVNMPYLVNHSNLYDACSITYLLPLKARYYQSTLLNQLSFCIPYNTRVFYVKELFCGQSIQKGTSVPNSCWRTMRLRILYLQNSLFAPAEHILYIHHAVLYLFLSSVKSHLLTILSTWAPVGQGLPSCFKKWKR